MSNIAIFLDRDGTIIEDRHYIQNPDEIIFLPGAIEGLKMMSVKGYHLYIVSNQSGVGRGILTKKTFQAVHDRFCQMIATREVVIDDFAYCFHSPEEYCECRKPQPGMVRGLATKHNIDLPRSFVVGDKLSDVELGIGMGMNSCLVRTGQGAESEAELGGHPLRPGEDIF